MAGIEDLHIELVLMVVKYLPRPDHAALARTSKRLYHKLQDLVEQHATRYSVYRRISTRHVASQGLANRAWAYLEELLEDKESTEYVECMDFSRRAVYFNNQYESLPQGQWPEPQIPLSGEPYEELDPQQLLMQMTNLFGYVNIWTNHQQELEYDQNYVSNESEDQVEKKDKSRKKETHALAVRAPIWYAAIKDDPWFQDLPRPHQQYCLFQLTPWQQKPVEREMNLVKQMIFNGGESAILAKLMVMATNLKTLNICFRLSDYCLLMVIKNIVRAYARILLYDPKTRTNSLPLSNLTKVTMLHWSNWYIEVISLLARIPSVEEIRCNHHGNYPTAAQRALFPIDSDGIDRQFSDIKTLVIETMEEDPFFEFREFPETFTGLQTFYLRYDPSTNILLGYLDGLLHSHSRTLKYLWFEAINWFAIPSPHLLACYSGTIPPYFQPMAFFHVLHTLHCSWSDLHEARTQAIELLVPSLRRLLLVHVPPTEEERVMKCLDMLPNLDEFGASVPTQKEWNRPLSQYVRDLAVPASCLIDASDGEDLISLRLKVLRRGIKWLTFGEKLELQRALTGN